MKRYLPYIRKHWYFFIFGPAFMVLEACGEFILPWLSANIINVGAANQDIGYILKNGLLMAAISLFMLICGVLGANFGTRGASELAADIRLLTFKKIQKFSFANVDKFSTGSLITRITNDISQIQNFTQMFLRGLFRSPVMIVGAIAMSFALEPGIGWIIFTILPLLGGMIAVIMIVSAPRYTVMQQQIDSLNTNVKETVTNQKVIKSFVREEYETDRFGKINESLQQKSTRVLKTMLLMQPLSTLIIHGATLLVVWFAGKRIMVGNMEVGTLTALITYLTQVMNALNFMANIILLGTRAAASNKRVVEVLEAEIDLKDDEAREKDRIISQGSIRFEGVDFRYYKHKKERVLRDINLEIEAGELVGIIGSSGAGKTTLVSLIPRLYDADEGRVYVDGIPTKDLSLFHLRESVAMVLQKNTLFSGTIAENLRWGNEDATQEELEEACRIAQADGFVRSFKEGYESLLKKYNGVDTKTGKKEMRVPTGADRNRALGMHGKPKNLKKTIGRLVRYLAHERKLLLIAITCAVVNTIATLAGSYLLRPIINTFIYYNPEESRIQERMEGLSGALILLAVIYLIAVSTQWVQQRLMLSVSQRSLKHLRNDLYHKVQMLPMKYFDNNATGDIMSRFTNDVDVVGEMLNTTLIQLISGMITISGTVVLMLVTNWLLGFITILVTPLLVLISKTIVKRGRSAYARQQKNLGMLNGFTEETISGQKVVKVFNHEEIAIDEFAYLNEELKKAQIKAQFQSSLMGPATHQLCNVVYAVTACVGGILVVKRGFDIGGLTISLNYTRQFNRPINEISMQMNTVFAALAGAERVFEVLDEEPEKNEGDTIKPKSIEGKIEVSHVDFGYAEGHPVLRDITLYAKPGQKIAFVGSTGAGKTTITNLLPRFYELQAGEIKIDGIPIHKLDKAVLRSNIAMVLQDTHLFTGTVRENIRYGRLEATDEEVVQAAKAAFAHSFIMQLEKGYDTLLENDGANLSQGQRQLLNIARAAISKAPILILDEATSSVDTRTEKHIEEGMDALMENRTTMVIAHRLSTVRKSNVIMVLEQGRIVERGTHEELLEMNGRYASLYHEIVELE